MLTSAVGTGAEMAEPEFGGDPRQQIDRQQIHRIHQENPDEYGQRQRAEEAAVAMEHVLDLAIDEFEHDFYKRLALARHASVGLARLQPEPKTEHKPSTSETVIESICTDQKPPSLDVRRLQVLQMVSNVFGKTALRLACHASTLESERQQINREAATSPVMAASGGNLY
jgi:hypothetical protein